MDKAYRIEATLSGELAELYAGVLEEFESRSDIPLATVNRTLLQTGLVHHLAMMHGLGLIAPEKARRLVELADRLARETIMWEVLLLVRTYWQKSAGGSVELEA
jgi:hypothetical protein